MKRQLTILLMGLMGLMGLPGLVAAQGIRLTPWTTNASAAEARSGLGVPNTAEATAAAQAAAQAATNDLNTAWMARKNADTNNAGVGYASTNHLIAADRRTMNVVDYGADPTGVANSYEAIQAAATRATAVGGRLQFPDGTFLLTNTVSVFGKTISTPWPIAGNIEVKGTRLSQLKLVALTNAIELTHGARFITVSDLHLTGTNYFTPDTGGETSLNSSDTTLRNPAINQMGFVFHGPSGVTRIYDINAQCFKYGFYLHDATGVYLDNIVAYSNLVGVAIGYQPDGTTVRGRFGWNEYGVQTRVSNTVQQTVYANPFSKISSSGIPEVSGVFGQNRVGVLIPGGPILLKHAYFESNTRSIQIGMNTAVGYEANYNTSLAGTALLTMDTVDYNNPQDIYVYRDAEIKAHGVRWSGTVIRLMNGTADANTVVDSDTAVTVINSSAVSMTVDRNYRYVNGSLLPRSGMSFTNLTDVPAGVGSLAINHPLNLEYVTHREEFMGGSTTSGQIGEMGWSYSGAANSLVTPYNQDWDGKREFTTAASSNSAAYVYLANHTVSVNATNFVSLFRFKIPYTNTAMVVVGLQNYGGGYEINYDSPGTGSARRSAGAFCLFTNGTQFRFERRSTGGAIGFSAASTVAANTNWNELMITRTNSTTYMGLNGETLVSLGTTFDGPTATYSPIFAVVTGEAVAKGIQVDYWGHLAARRRNDGY